ncbi:hypothetical protein NDU88_001052 [Pleurodeles waltl]|uniref:Uncharacterized protein n=1 Tax=Pleurodeles waltl TaxID=8319 RepID=A0AAV7VA61_PLEWA|nr:hypothetical protein NDU88_001052 [Pleurodeles waltl]
MLVLVYRSVRFQVIGGIFFHCPVPQLCIRATTCVRAKYVVRTMQLGEFGPGLRWYHTGAWAAAILRGGRSATPSPVRRLANSTPLVGESSRALTFNVGSEPRALSKPVRSSTSVPHESTWSLSTPEAEPAYGSGRQRPRSRPQALAQQRIGRSSARWAASASRVKLLLLMEVLGGRRDDSCLGES